MLENIFNTYAAIVPDYADKPWLVRAFFSHALHDSRLPYHLVDAYVTARFRDSVPRLPAEFIVSVNRVPLWFHLRGLMQTATGYGSKLKTEYIITCADKRKRRVYCSCFSNVGSLYVIVSGIRFYLDDMDLSIWNL